MLLDGHEVRENLRRVVGVGESVPNRHAGEARKVFHDLLSESAVLDRVIVAAQYLRRVLKRLLLAHLAVAQIRHMRALVQRRNLKRAARARAGLVENQHDVFVPEALGKHALALFALDRMAQVEQVANLFGGIVEQG